MDPEQTANIVNIEDQLDAHMLKKRSIVGALAYTSRTAILQAISLVAVFLLTVFLSPEEYGIFFLVDATVGFLVYFSDIGLAAALIQKKAALTKQDLATTFTLQQILVLSLCSVAFLATNNLSAYFNYSTQARILFQALIFSFFLSSLKTIPSILLERELKFNRLVIPQILENLCFYAVAVIAAWQGRGVESFTLAVITRAVVGFFAIYLLKPWMPQLGLNVQVAKSLVSFGAPFQLNSIMSLFKDRLLIIFLGKVLPVAQIGYLGWAEKWAMTPIRFFVEPILKVTFPAFSRLQDKPDELKKAIQKSIFFVSTLVFPSVFGMILLAPLLVSSIPKYGKWEPAILALSFYATNALFSSISIVLTNTLNATGHVKDTLRLMIMWTVLTWVLTVTLIKPFGYNGVALASAITASSSLIGLYYVNKIIRINFMANIFHPLLASIVMIIPLYFTSKFISPSIFHVLFLVMIGGAIYFLTLLFTGKERLLLELKIVTKYLRSQ